MNQITIKVDKLCKITYNYTKRNIAFVLYIAVAILKRRKKGGHRYDTER